MLATSYHMVTFSSHSGNIWCGQPKDRTSVEKPRSMSQMAIPRWCLQMTQWKKFDTILLLLGTESLSLNNMWPNWDRIVYISLRVSSKIQPKLGTKWHSGIMAGHWVHSLLSTTLPLLKIQPTLSTCSTPLIYPTYKRLSTKLLFFRIHSESLSYPKSKLLTEQVNSRKTVGAMASSFTNRRDQRGWWSGLELVT